ncbi:MAG: tRNA (guanosine(46)-N7)-methyltransferase TrmB [Ginsengibacter sp.]
MAQKKLARFREIDNFKNVLQYPEGMAGTWYRFFNNDNPVVLELACGKGEYTIELAKMTPEKNYIGVDIKGNRIWVGAKNGIGENISNAAFLRTQIDKIDQYFSKGEVEEIWLTFPDPHLRKSKAKKRLTHPKFLRLYSRFITDNGLIHLKTDSPDLYQFTKTVIELYQLKTVQDIPDVFSETTIPDNLKIKTHYESLDISNSNKIFYLCFSLPDLLNSSDEDLHKLLKKEE